MSLVKDARREGTVKYELNSLTHHISQRVAGFLEREGLLVRDDDNDYLALDGLEDVPMLQIQGLFHYLSHRHRQTARTKGLYLANHCTYRRARACVRLRIKCGKLQSPCRCHEQCTG